MKHITGTINNKKALLIILWVSITFSQVIYKTAQRPGELTSTLIITVAVIGAIFGLMTLYTKLHQSSLGHAATTA